MLIAIVVVTYKITFIIFGEKMVCIIFIDLFIRFMYRYTDIL